MRNILFARMKPLLPAIVCVLVAASSRGEEGLSPMAGTGGFMRDAERRLSVDLSEKKTLKAGEMAPEGKGEDQLAPEDAKVVGEIAAIRFFGSAEFAQEHGIADRLLAALGPGEKTLGDVKKAIVQVRKDMMNEGFYLLRLLISRKEVYDKESKTLSILVDEGRFGKLNIKFDGEEDGYWFSKEQIYRRFRQIKEGDTFDYNRLRGLLFDANGHPDLTIDTAISVRKPIEGEGNDRRVARYADLDLDVRESCPFHAVWEINNYGMEEVEEWQTSLTLQYLNLTKHDDVLTVSPSMSFNGELASFAASYLLPHHWWLGGNTTLYGGWSYLDTDDIVPQLDLEGIGWFVGLQHSEYIIENDNHMLLGSVGLLWRYIEDQYSAYGYKLNERDISVLPVSAAISYTRRTPDALGGRNFANVQVLMNVATCGDDADEVWTDADDNYWAIRWQLARLQPLFGFFDQDLKKDLHQWVLFSKLEGQYSSDNLIPTEKLSLGGYNTVRGYHSRGYLGDYGIYGTFELRTPILVDTCASIFSDRDGKYPFDRLQALVFTDYGYSCYNDLPSGYDEDEWLWSVGVGLRAAMTKYCQARCDVAFPVHDGNNPDDDDMEVYFCVQFQY